MTAVVFDKRYVEDTEYIFDETICADRVEDVQKKGGHYDFITLSCYLDELPADNAMEVFEILFALLSPQGLLLIPARNPSSARELWELMTLGGRDVYAVPGMTKRFSGVSLQSLIRNLQNHPLVHHLFFQSVSYLADGPLVERLQSFIESFDDKVDTSMLSDRMIFIGIRKEEQV